MNRYGLDRYRHVTFADAIHGCGRAVDLAPWQPRAIAGDEPAVASPEEHCFLRWLFRQRRLNAGHYREQMLLRRLPACLRTLRVGSLQQARLLLQRHPEMVDAALSAILIGVSSLFRDGHVFQCLRRQVLPSLAAQRGGRLRIWSAGCSNGAELYSVALLLEELGILDDCELLGTDCRSEAIAQALAGRFDRADAQDVPADLQHHLQFEQNHVLMSRWLRRRISWRVSDFMVELPGGRWDLVLCRNTIMYMRPGAIPMAWARLRGALDADGVLVAGKAERPLGAWPMHMIAPCIYRC